MSKDIPGQLVICVNEVGPGFRACVTDLRGTSTIGCLKSSTSFQTPPVAQNMVHVRIWGSAGWHVRLSTFRKYSKTDIIPQIGALLWKFSPVLKRNYLSFSLKYAQHGGHEIKQTQICPQACSVGVNIGTKFQGRCVSLSTIQEGLSF